MKNMEPTQEERASRIETPWMNTNECTVYLGCSRSALYTLIKQGLPNHRLGKVRRFHKGEVDAWLFNQGDLSSTG